MAKPKRVRSGPSRPEQTIDGLGSRYEHVSLDKVDVEGQQVRSEDQIDHVVELSNSIAKHGLLEPIIVTPRNGRYQLVAGKHRLMACQRLGWITIPAHVREEREGEPIKGLALVENLVRQDLTLEEEVSAVLYLRDHDGLSPNQICDQLGKSRAWVDRRLACPSMPESVRTAVFENLLPLGSAEEICRLEDPAAQNEVLNRAIYGKLPRHVVRDLVEVFLSAPTITTAVEQGLQTATEIQSAPAQQRSCQACGRAQHYSELIYIPVCRAGCPAAAGDPE